MILNISRYKERERENEINRETDIDVIFWSGLMDDDVEREREKERQRSIKLFWWGVLIYRQYCTISRYKERGIERKKNKIVWGCTCLWEIL